MNGNGSGYTGTIRPEAGAYFSKLESSLCPGRTGNFFEVITVKEDSSKALIQNECTQTSSEVDVAQLGAQAYRKDHIVHDGRIYEHEMSRSAEYFNEALCDFSDRKFGILIRWYDAYLFHVAHIFPSNSAAHTVPAIRYSDYDFGNGNFGTGYLGTDFQLAVLDNYKMAENAFAGYFNGKVGNQQIEGALGICVTTTYTCQPVTLDIIGQSTSGHFKVQTTGTPATPVSGDLTFSGDIGQLNLTVQKPSKEAFACSGYVTKMNNELALGGCFNMPTDGSTPKKTMIQVRGQILWTSSSTGTANAKVCFDTTTP
ncbi:MAG: hypothetical protein K2X47_13990 [Bdellovibrionales bacterium]|nr:hypothetical protein [Bdellovibrionales bacterium]